MAQPVRPLRVILFNIKGDCFGIVNNSVSEVIVNNRLTPAPRIHPFLAGAMPFQGRIIPVLDLPGLLGRGCGSGDQSARSGDAGHGDAGSGKTQVIVLTYEGRFIGLTTDGVDDIYDLESLKIKTVIVRDYNSAIDGVGSLNERLFFLLNAEKIITAEKAFDREVETLVLEKMQVKTA